MTQPEKMELTSMDVAAQKREELKQALGNAFPDVFAEGFIDFDQLKRVLGEWIDPSKERFGLSWPGKAECMKVVQQPSIATLKPMRKDSIDFDTTDNVFIEGDNLEVLKLLQKSYFGKISLIYIDPPYNTGKEFIYPDKYSETLSTYLSYTSQVDEDGKRFSTNTDSSGRFHSNWLNMMYPRIYLAKNLLSDSGIFCASIDNHELFNLKHLLDIVFGEENFISCVANISNPKGRSDDKYIATSHEYILIYKKLDANIIGWPAEENVLRRYNKTEPSKRQYREIDLRKTGDQDKRTDRPKMFYPFFYDEKTAQLRTGSVGDAPPPGWREIVPTREDGVEGRWRWGKDTADAQIDKLIARHMPNKGDWSVFEKDYLDEREGVKPTSSWSFKDVNSERGSEQLIDLGFDKEVFQNPKPVGTLKRIVQISTPSIGAHIILDFFAGSATLAQAVLEQNAEDQGDRSFIVVQLPEKIRESEPAFNLGYRNIAQISRDRVRRAIEAEGKRGIGELEFSGKRNDKLGFRSFSLGQSNFKIWDGNPDTFDELGSQLSLHVDYVVGPASPDDILYELLLKAGFPLSTKVLSTKLAGKLVFSVGDGALLICLEKEITFDLINALAEANPLQVICLDEGFKGNDQLKANAVQTFKARAQAEESEIVFRTV